MTNSLGTLLVALLQKEGVHSDDFNFISDAVFKALNDIDLQMNAGDVLELPRGSCLTKTFDPKDIK